MRGVKRSRLGGLVAMALAMWCFQPGRFANSAFGQLGWQQQVQAHINNTVRQQQNHAAERALYNATQKPFLRRMEQDRSPSQQRIRNGRQYDYGNGPSWQPQSYQAPIQPGDKVVAMYSVTPVQIAEKKVAEVTSGTTLSVIQREGAWVGVQVPQNDGLVAGWIRVSHVRRIGSSQ